MATTQCRWGRCKVFLSASRHSQHITLVSLAWPSSSWTLKTDPLTIASADCHSDVDTTKNVVQGQACTFKKSCGNAEMKWPALQKTEIFQCASRFAQYKKEKNNFSYTRIHDQKWRTTEFDRSHAPVKCSFSPRPSRSSYGDQNMGPDRSTSKVGQHGVVQGH